MRATRTPRRVVITGLGAFSPTGTGVAACARWQEDGWSQPGGRVPDFDAAKFIRNPRRLRTMHRSFQLATAAAVMAFEAAGLAVDQAFAPERAGLATALADIAPVTPDLLQLLAGLPKLGREPDTWARFAELGAGQLHPFRRLALLANMASAHTSLLLNLQGPGFTFTSGSAAGMQVITESFWTIAAGRADLMVAQSASSPEQAYTSAPEAELAAAVVLEDWEHAVRRGATIVAELVPGQRQSLPFVPGLAPAPELLRILVQIGQGGCLALHDLALPATAERMERPA